jgi:hypothetical protein
MPTAVPQVARASSARRLVLDTFVSIPGSTLLTPPATLAWPPKDPGDTLDYEFDISPALVGNEQDTIATIDVQIVPGASGDLTLNSAEADGAVAVLWLSAGQPGVVYSVQITITTTAGRTIARAIWLPVLALLANVPTAAALTTTTGTTISDESGSAILVGS